MYANEWANVAHDIEINDRIGLESHAMDALSIRAVVQDK